MTASEKRMESNAASDVCRVDPRLNQRVPLPYVAPAKPSHNGSVIDEKLKRLERLARLGTLSASFAHEIKNAMVAVRTFVEMLLDQNKDAELRDIVKREMLRIDSIATQMLRLGAKPRPSSSEIHLNEVLERALRLIQPQLDARKIRLKRNLLAGPDLLRGDADQLEQAFTNILLNAIDAIEPSARDAELSVSSSVLRVPGGARTKAARCPALQITISDTGIGLSIEEQSKLFEPFFTTKPNGTGLGLAITRDIVEQHRGTISVESERNKGATFRILFPLLAANAGKPSRKG
jgi:two-component system sensor histidine kinase HydH